MRKFLILACLACLVSCQSQSPQVTHVVICWLKTPGDAAARGRLIAESEKLKKIPGLISLTAGRPIPSNRPIVDSSYDVAFIMTFKDEKALRDYEKNPIHTKAVSEVLRPLTAKQLIYDIRRTTSNSAKERAGATTTPAPVSANANVP